MAVTYGFYNSLNGDRKYNAEQLSSIFDGIISDGVFATVGDAFAVTASGLDFSVQVGTGRAWFNRTWTNNDMPFSIVLQPPDLIQDRIDSIILEVDASDSVRANYIKVIPGTPNDVPVEPVLENTLTKHQYRLASIYVTVGATVITQSKITNKIGLAECPFITGLIDTIDIASLVAQWESEFSIWFNNLVIQLSGDVAGNLQNQINNLPSVSSSAEADSGLDNFKYLSPKAVKDSTNIPNAVPGDAGNILVSNGTKWVSLTQTPSELVAKGRITISSDSPIPTIDISSSKTLYYTPFQGNTIHLWKNNKWNLESFQKITSTIPALALGPNTRNNAGIGAGSSTIIFNEPPMNTNDLTIGQYVRVTNYPFKGRIVSKTSTTITLDTTYSGTFVQNAIVTFPLYEEVLYDVFAYLDGDVKLDYKIWNANLTARGSALSLKDGVLVLESDETRRYLGTIKAVEGGDLILDQASSRNVWNYYNRVPRILRVANTAAHAYSTAAWRLWNGGSLPSSAVLFVVGIEEEPIFASGSASWVASAGTMITNFALGINSVTVPDDDYRFNGVINTQRYASLPSKSYYSGIGSKYIAMLENWVSGTSVNWINMAINGHIMA